MTRPTRLGRGRPIMSSGKGLGGTARIHVGDLNDVNLDGLDDGDTLVWDEDTQTWIRSPTATPFDYGVTGDITTLAFGDAPDGGALDDVARADHRHGMPAAPGLGLIPVDTGTVTYDTSGDPVEVAVETVWGVDAGVPYYDAAGSVAGEEAALYWDPADTLYVLITYDF